MTRVSDETANDDGFVTRWARRKAEAKSDAGAMPAGESQSAAARVQARGRMITEPIVVAPEPNEPHESGEAGELAVANISDEHGTTGTTGELEPRDASGEEDAGADEEALAELEAIDIEALDYSADFTRFMQPGVPEALRRRALRRLWRTNPLLANVDGLNDYDEDYRDAALAVDVLKTIHRVGKGYLTDDEVEAYQVAKDEADAEAKAKVEAETEAETETETGGEDSVSAGAGDEDDAVESPVADGPEPPDDDRVEADATIAARDDDADDADVDDDDGDLDKG